MRRSKMAEKVPEHEKEQEIQIDEAQSDPPLYRY